LNRIHIEEDAGKLIHVEDEDISYIDYNRVGVPLIEIVSEPDMRSVDEAVEFLRMLKGILEFSDISDCRMEQGSLRCDANISIREMGSDVLNTKVELKNLNSFKELQKALEKEEKRQLELYSFGEQSKIKQETRRWDAGKGKTVSMRSKEEAHDYRYFPEPDLVPIIVRQETVDNAIASLPEMPKAKKARFMSQYGLTEKEAAIIIDDRALAKYYETAVAEGGDPKTAANWVLGDILRLLKDKDLESAAIPVSPEALVKLLGMIKGGQVSTTAAKEVFDEMFVSGKSADTVVAEKGLAQISDTSEIEKIADDILDANPQSIEDFKAGKKQAAGFLMGQLMKASKGKANPQVAKELLDRKLSER
ncbi:MAG TPA: Asp-tRNA(Asn)/Glu-tRNA(Gln) amidotransferase subunit GatB, partial [Clostridiaceae bacterium]|nr:Asp-tRNA(Asn)/Glu-tRNA(Gln) amidotransferase subunit GatB [Clostridiaceae bacterium]